MKYNKLKNAAQPIIFLLLTLTLLAAPGCNTGGDKSKLALKILHVNDVHSHLDPSEIDLTLGGVKTTCEIGGMARVASKINELAETNKNHLVLHAGDAVQGTLYYTLFNGQADADIMNAMGFDAMAIGNHEFDNGDQWLANFIAMVDAPLVSTNIEVISGNVLDGLYSPYVITQVDGEPIGIIGLTIAGKTRDSSRPSNEVTFNEEVAATQAAVDELKEQGIRKILLLSHCGYKNMKALAPLVTDIDIIVDGDSHTLLGDFTVYGLDSLGDYPTRVRNRDGETVCVVQAWEYGKVLGELDVYFNGDELESCSGTPHLILGKSFVRKDSQGAPYVLETGELTSVLSVIDADSKLDTVAEDEYVADIISTYSTQVDALGKTVIGRADEALPHSRVPGHDYSGRILPLGSHIAPVVARAFYQLDGNADICIQNAGGVRISIMQGEITYDTAYTLLPFSNTLYEIKMYGSEIKAVLEDAIDNIAQGGSTGSFPYSYPLKYDVDANQPFGSRVSNLEVKDRHTDTYSSLQNDTLYVVVTNNYTAKGRDGYTTFATVQAQRGEGTDTYLDYALSFVNYVKGLAAKGEDLVPIPAGDHCIKSYIATVDETDNL
ncbi:UshA [Desulforapulum autotrophicum HRM2]|uniref:UshA n=1 Tax=Desulforapulum autotrophicum (strain ATCC 43914 / DSM 3382 / VKM B-1955 / HRM2) TaxID=177437 RepID=C0QKK6_DESAH|nr:NAD nucleotidase [Desulforapulum autotrophicum]ACN14077.1 UshA [Desulforapulum autotrophicum HRM2]